jgi:hypothetical protein
VIDFLLGDPDALTLSDLPAVGATVPAPGGFAEDHTQPLGDGRGSQAEAPRGPLLAAGVGGILAQALALGGIRSADGATDAAATPAEAPVLVADLIQRSAEAFTRLAQDFYRLFLGRSPADGEEQGWVQMFLSGLTAEDVLSNFLGTPEFAARAAALHPNGSADEGYVRSLFDLLLHRDPTEDELAGWLASLPALGRPGVASFLLRSEEYRGLVVSGYYQAVAGRPATPAEAAAWAASPFALLAIRAFLDVQLGDTERRAPETDVPIP